MNTGATLREPPSTLHTFTVEQDAQGARLDRWLAVRLSGLSRARIQALIAAEAVLLDGRSARPSARLRPGQTVSATVPPPDRAIPEPEDMPLSVVHEDARLIVVDKPAGLVVHPAGGARRGTLVNALLAHTRDLSGVGGVLRPGIVHRLDRGTSGLLVVAKDDATHRSLARQFAGRSVSKEYLALVLGVPPAREGTIAAPIGRDPVHRKRMSARVPRGREARTDYAVVEAFDGAALLRVRPHTGRTHQIRVHLASIGHPVAGDATYGGTRMPPSRRAAAREALRSLRRPGLHAAALAFTHPETGQAVRFESPVAADIALVLELLRAAR